MSYCEVRRPALAPISRPNDRQLSYFTHSTSRPKLSQSSLVAAGAPHYNVRVRPSAETPCIGHIIHFHSTLPETLRQTTTNCTQSKYCIHESLVYNNGCITVKSVINHLRGPLFLKLCPFKVWSPSSLQYSSLSLDLVT